MIRISTPLPDFELADQDGRLVGSASLTSARLALYFYPKDFTPGCTTEAGQFASNYTKFQKAGIEVIGVSPDDAPSHRRFCNKEAIPYRLLADTDHKVAKMFGVWGKKKFMGREYMGVSRTTFLADEKGVIVKIFEKVKPQGHADEVLAFFGV